MPEYSYILFHHSFHMIALLLYPIYTVVALYLAYYSEFLIIYYHVLYLSKIR